MIEQNQTSESSAAQHYSSNTSASTHNSSNSSDANIECSVVSDGLLVIKLRGKPDKVPLDAQFLPVTLPEGWELREIQTNQRCRSTKRSRKTRIKNKVNVSESRISSQQQLQHQTESEATSASHFSDFHHRKNELVRHNNQESASEQTLSGGRSGGSGPVGHHSDEEFEEGQRGNIAYTTKIRRSVTDGPYGTSTMVQKGHTEEVSLMQCSIIHPSRLRNE